MAHIKRRPNAKGEPRYTVVVRKVGRPPETATFGSLTQARAWAKQIEAALEAGKVPGTEARRHTLANAIDRYCKTRTLAPSKATQLAWWRDKLGAFALAEISAARIAQCRDELAAGLYRRPNQNSLHARSPATCNRYLAALSPVLSIAAREWEWIALNPVAKVKKFKEPPGRVRFLEADERRRLLEAAQASRTPYLRLVVVLALSTGARYNELLTLQWRQVDLNAGAIILERTKNGDRRRLPLKGLALALMKEHGKLRRLDAPLCFPSSADPAKPALIRKAFEQAVKRSGIENFKFHDLRHSCASYLAMNGASLAEISEVLGHRQLSMVKRYAHLSDGHVAAVVQRMNAAVFDDAIGEG